MSKLFSDKNISRAKSINGPVEPPQEKKSEPEKVIEASKEVPEEKKATPKIEKTEASNRLIFGYNDKKKPIFIPESSRYFNTLVLGVKGTGKTTGLLPFFVEQDMKNKQVGLTVIASSREISYTLYTLAKQYKRKVIFIKPSINNEVSNKFLFKTDYDYDYIDMNLVCYKDAIKSKSVIIIDMETLKYKSEAIKAVAMLLLQLQLDIQETDLTNRTPHFLYIDDAYIYIPFLKYLLLYGDTFNLGITLFFNSRNQFGEYESLINNTVRNLFLLNSLTKEDAEYYQYKFQDTETNLHSNRGATSLLYEIVDAQFTKRTGQVNYKRMTPEEVEVLEKKSKKLRTKLLKDKRTQQELSLRDDLKSVMGEKSVKGEPIPIEESILEEDKIMDFTSETEEERLKSEELKHEEIRNQIIEEEKAQKRELATKSFNNMNKKIDYCDDNFDFQF